jgi:hypothetical protein
VPFHKQSDHHHRQLEEDVDKNSIYNASTVNFLRPQGDSVYNSITVTFSPRASSSSFDLSSEEENGSREGSTSPEDATSQCRGAMKDCGGKGEGFEDT